MSFLFIPTISSILFLEISLKMHSLQPYLSLCLIWKHCRGETGTIRQQSTKSWVHLRMRSDLVSTFCCSCTDINHSAEHSSTCCTKLTASPQARGHRGSRLFISPEWELLIPPVSLWPFISFGFCAITITHPGPLHMIVLYQPPGPPDMTVRLAASLVNCLKMVQSSFSYVTSNFPQRGLFP